MTTLFNLVSKFHARTQIESLHTPPISLLWGQFHLICLKTIVFKEFVMDLHKPISNPCSLVHKGGFNFYPCSIIQEFCSILSTWINSPTYHILFYSWLSSNFIIILSHDLWMTLNPSQCWWENCLASITTHNQMVLNPLLASYNYMSWMYKWFPQLLSCFHLKSIPQNKANNQAMVWRDTLSLSSQSLRAIH